MASASGSSNAAQTTPKAQRDEQAGRPRKQPSARQTARSRKKQEEDDEKAMLKAQALNTESQQPDPGEASHSLMADSGLGVAQPPACLASSLEEAAMALAMMQQEGGSHNAASEFDDAHGRTLCPQCGFEWHDDDASCCVQCGAKLTGDE